MQPRHRRSVRQDSAAVYLTLSQLTSDFPVAGHTLLPTGLRVYTPYGYVDLPYIRSPYAESRKFRVPLPKHHTGQTYIIQRSET